MVYYKKSTNEKCLLGDVFVQTSLLNMVMLSTDYKEGHRIEHFASALSSGTALFVTSGTLLHMSQL